MNMAPELSGLFFDAKKIMEGVVTGRINVQTAREKNRDLGRKIQELQQVGVQGRQMTLRKKGPAGYSRS